MLISIQKCEEIERRKKERQKKSLSKPKPSKTDSNTNLHVQMNLKPRNISTSNNQNNKEYKNKSKTPDKDKNKVRPVSGNKLKKGTSNNNIPSNNLRIEPIENKISKEANKKLLEKEMLYNKKSNKNLVKSAISNICLAGNPNSECRAKVIQHIDDCNCDNFIILFKNNIGRFVSYF